MATKDPVLVLDREDVRSLLLMLGADPGRYSFGPKDYGRFNEVLGGATLVSQMQLIAQRQDRAR